MNIEQLFERPADPRRTPPEQRVLIATLDCIAERGLAGTTARAIAAKADVNPAAVNYYFRSKERLVEAALRYAWSHVSEDIGRIMTETKGKVQSRKVVAQYLIEGAVRYPNIIRAIVLDHPALRAEAVAFFSSLLTPLSVGREKDEGAGLGTSLLLAFTLFLGIAPEAVEELVGAHLSEPAAREKLAELVAPRFFG